MLVYENERLGDRQTQAPAGRRISCLRVWFVNWTGRPKRSRAGQGKLRICRGGVGRMSDARAVTCVEGELASGMDGWWGEVGTLVRRMSGACWDRCSFSAAANQDSLGQNGRWSSHQAIATFERVQGLGIWVSAESNEHWADKLPRTLQYFHSELGMQDRGRSLNPKWDFRFREPWTSSTGGPLVRIVACSCTRSAFNNNDGGPVLCRGGETIALIRVDSRGHRSPAEDITRDSRVRVVRETRDPAGDMWLREQACPLWAAS